MRIAALLLALAGPAVAQAQEAEASAGYSEQRMQDEIAINAALNAVYAAISGPAGQPRDWDAMRALFTPEARLTAIRANGVQGGTVDDYIAKSGPFLIEHGFTETALVNRIEIYGDLAQAWSSYAGSWTNPDGSPGTVRGINSFQLMRQQDGRWLVQSIFWQAETPENPLPADMEQHP